MTHDSKQDWTERVVDLIGKFASRGAGFVLFAAGLGALVAAIAFRFTITATSVRPDDFDGRDHAH